MRAMGQHGKIVRLFVVVWWLSGWSVDAAEPPRMDPTGEQSILVDRYGGSSLNYTAAGRECIVPEASIDENGQEASGSTEWQAVGDMVYVWSYDNGPDGIVGSPAPDEVSSVDTTKNNDTLRLNTNEGGSTSIRVYAVQWWKANDGRTAMTRSPVR